MKNIFNFFKRKEKQVPVSNKNKIEELANQLISEIMKQNSINEIDKACCEFTIWVYGNKEIEIIYTGGSEVLKECGTYKFHEEVVKDEIRNKQNYNQRI